MATTKDPTTSNPTTDSPTTDNPTTDSPTTNNPTTYEPSLSPTTADPTAEPTTNITLWSFNTTESTNMAPTVAPNSEQSGWGTEYKDLNMLTLGGIMVLIAILIVIYFRCIKKRLDEKKLVQKELASSSELNKSLNVDSDEEADQVIDIEEAAKKKRKALTKSTRMNRVGSDDANDDGTKKSDKKSATKKRKSSTKKRKLSTKNTKINSDDNEDDDKKPATTNPTSTVSTRVDRVASDTMDE